MVENKSVLKQREEWVVCVCVCVCGAVAILPWQYGWHWQLWQFQLLSRWVIGLTGDKWGSVCLRALLCARVPDMFTCVYHICVCQPAPGEGWCTILRITQENTITTEHLDAWAPFVTRLGDTLGGHRSLTAWKQSFCSAIGSHKSQRHTAHAELETEVSGGSNSTGLKQEFIMH